MIRDDRRATGHWSGNHTNGTFDSEEARDIRAEGKLRPVQMER